MRQLNDPNSHKLANFIQDSADKADFGENLIASWLRLNPNKINPAKPLDHSPTRVLEVFPTTTQYFADLWHRHPEVKVHFLHFEDTKPAVAEDYPFSHANNHWTPNLHKPDADDCLDYLYDVILLPRNFTLLAEPDLCRTFLSMLARNLKAGGVVVCVLGIEYLYPFTRVSSAYTLRNKKRLLVTNAENKATLSAVMFGRYRVREILSDSSTGEILIDRATDITMHNFPKINVDKSETKVYILDSPMKEILSGGNALEIYPNPKALDTLHNVGIKPLIQILRKS